MQSADIEAEVRHPGFHHDGRRTSGAWVVERHDFGVCPICLSTKDLTEEHVPMRALGGRAMTRTCKECNNRLGSLSEAALSALVAGEVVVEAESDALDGFRGVRKATAALRQAPFSPPTMHVTSGDPELLTTIAAGEPLSVRYRLLDPVPSGIAILKYAYLAACVWLREIPYSQEAKSIRAVLMAVRDGQELSEDVRKDVVGLVNSMVLVENPSYDLGPIVLVEPTSTDAGWAFVLGQRLRCPWPFTGLQPTDRRDP